MVIDFEIKFDASSFSETAYTLAIVVEITNVELETLDYEYKSIYDMTNDLVVFEHELTIEELDAVDAEIIKRLESLK